MGQKCACIHFLLLWIGLLFRVPLSRCRRPPLLRCFMIWPGAALFVTVVMSPKEKQKESWTFHGDRQHMAVLSFGQQKRPV